MFVVDSRLSIPLDEFEIIYARSSGPGGQNVNKVNSKAQLRWPVLSSPSLSPQIRERLLARHGKRVTGEGILLVTSQRFRDQGKNVADCFDRLREMLLEAATPRRTRKETKPPRRARERRLRDKQVRSQVKQGRGRPSRDE